MASASEVQVFVDWHYRQCVRALQIIAMLADTGSDIHKKKFCPNGEGDGIPNGWRVAEAMREIANDTVGYLPERASDADRPRGFWCQFNTKGQCLDLVEGNPNDPIGIEYVWIQEGVEELEIYKRAMESMAKQFVHPKTTALELAKTQLGIK